MKILLIEDDSTIRSVLSQVLSQNGHEVSACMLIREAAVLLAVNSFDLIVSDVGLPDGNGLDFCSQQVKVPFVIMSGSGCSESARANGAKAYIEKPFNTGDILKAVSDV